MADEYKHLFGISEQLINYSKALRQDSNLPMQICRLQHSQSATQFAALPQRSKSHRCGLFSDSSQSFDPQT